MKTLPFVLLALATLAFAGCSSGTTAISLVSSAGMWLTRDADPGPADLTLQTAQHENWCYETMGYAECYDTPQNGRGGGLVSVDPQNRYPLNSRAYQEAVFTSRSEEKAAAVVSTSAPAASTAPVPVSKAVSAPAVAH